jgi:hypothetical protein
MGEPGGELGAIIRADHAVASLEIHAQAVGIPEIVLDALQPCRFAPWCCFIASGGQHTYATGYRAARYEKKESKLTLESKDAARVRRISLRHLAFIVPELCQRRDALAGFVE